ncbi:MAG: DNA-binding response regulator [Nitrospina sp.]|nr:DNA-binding response regulator [Nitrospina sp.]MDC0206986.1 response regulator transcription factor [Nitrospinota bacterium]|tara:strand:- start:1121 stop:1804 length:684 start_codon:yes stop_codon:yes gene_type:complete
MSKKIAVIEDNKTNIKLIRYQLEMEDFDVHIEETGAAGLKMIKNQKPDMVILDIGLPDIDGFELCKTLRKDKVTKDYPIIMLTAKGEDRDKIEGLKLGADDYITKPYNADELILRIKNLLTRSIKYKENNGFKKVKELEVDYSKREVKVKGKLVNLTFSEYQILNLLIDNPGKVYTKKELNRIIFNINEEVESRTIDTHVHNLRKKLKSSGSLINTIRSVGFIFKTD